MPLHRWSSHRDTHLSTHMKRWRREARGIITCWWSTIALLWWCGLCCGCFDNRGESIGGDETHEKKGLEDSIGQLWGLLQKFCGFCWVACCEGFHLGEDIEKLSGRKGIESSGDCIGAGEAGREVDASWKGRQ